MLVLRSIWEEWVEPWTGSFETCVLKPGSTFSSVGLGKRLDLFDALFFSVRKNENIVRLICKVPFIFEGGFFFF